MKQTATDLLHSIARLIPEALLIRWVRREVLGIFYHVVSDAPVDHIQHLYPIVPVAAFKEALKFMQERFTFITYDQLQGYLEGVTPLPPKAVHLSFDDGFAECYTVVRPILQEEGIPCTFFLTLDWLDNRMLYFRHQISLFVERMETLDQKRQKEVIRQINQRLDLSLDDRIAFKDWITTFREPDEGVLAEVASPLEVDREAYLVRTQPYLTTLQVHEMQADGFTIGAHGLTHRKLGFIPKEEVEVEIVESCRAVQKITGQKVVPFSFPQSAGNVDRDQLADIRARYPQVGLLFDTKDLTVDAPFMVNRIWAERPLTPERRLHQLQEIVSNAYCEAWVEGVLGKIRGLM